ncbi:MAG: choice-of-anchor tandem repeat NxxGxxAF-containing protein [Planctomycetota bacterium]
MLAGTFAWPCVALAGSLDAEDLVDVVAITGEVAPGGGVFSSFRSNSLTGPGSLLGPTLDSSGNVVFRARTSGVAADVDTGIFGRQVAVDGSTSLVAAVREGDLVDGGPATFGDFIERLELNRPRGIQQGNVAFRVDLQDVVDQDGVFRVNLGSTPTVTARTNTVSTTGEPLDTFDRVTATRDGDVAFRAIDATPGSTGLGVYLSPVGSAQVLTIARRGDSVGSDTFTNLDNLVAGDVVGGTAQVAFRGSLQTLGNFSGVFVGDGTTVETIALSGDAADDGNGGTSGTLGQFEGLDLNTSGTVAFFARIEGSGVSGDSGLFRDNGVTAQAELIARRGQAADGGGVFEAFVNTPSLNDLGDVAFVAALSDTAGGSTTRLAVYLDAVGADPVAIARGGDAAPGDTGTFDAFGFDGFAPPSLNESGQVAFTATTTKDGISGDGIFLFDPIAGLVKVVRTGDLIDGSAITDIGFQFGSGDALTGLSDSGDVAFSFKLADARSGIGVWRAAEGIVVIPSPLSAVGGMVMLGTLTLRRRRSV